MCDGNVCVTLATSELINGSCFSSLKDYYRPANRLRTLPTSCCETGEQRVYDNRAFGAEKNVLNSFVVVGGEGGEKEKVRIAKVLLLCRCSEKGDKRGHETGNYAAHGVHTAFGSRA